MGVEEGTLGDDGSGGVAANALLKVEYSFQS
jgi:hypothetical protein